MIDSSPLEWGWHGVLQTKKKEYDALQKQKKKDTHVDAGDVDERPMWTSEWFYAGRTTDSDLVVPITSR